MSGVPHDHSTFVPGCFRCELSRDEVEDRNPSPSVSTPTEGGIVDAMHEAIAAWKRSGSTRYTDLLSQFQARATPIIARDVERATAQAIVERLRTGEGRDPHWKAYARAADFVAREFLPSPGSEEEK